MTCDDRDDRHLLAKDRLDLRKCGHTLCLISFYGLLLKEVVHPVGDRIHYFSREVTVVKTPRVFDWRVSPVFLPNVAMGAAAGLIVGLFTMPPFFWWRRHAP